MGPMCFDYGFGPFRWVCASGNINDLEKTDQIAANVLRDMIKTATDDIQSQLKDNLHWIETAKDNLPIVGSLSRILYADAVGRIAIAKAFNQAIGSISQTAQNLAPFITFDIDCYGTS